MKWTRSGHWLFCYGTLQQNCVYARAAGVTPTPLIRARLSNWRLVAIPGANYPGAIPAKRNVRIDGGLRLVRTKEEWAALDAYEGPTYQRLACTVEIASGRVSAFVYRYLAQLKPMRLSTTACISYSKD